MDDLAHAAEALAGEEPKGKRAAIIREMPCEDCGKVLRQARFPLPPNRVLCPPCRRTWERGRKYEARRLNAGAAVPVAVPDALAAPEHDAPDVAVLLAERATLIQRRRDHLERCVDIQAACQDLYHEFDYRYAEVLAAQDRLADIDDALAP